MPEDVHPRRVPPQEDGLLRRVRALDEVERAGVHLVVHRLHPLLGERAGVLDRTAGLRADHAARAELLLERGILGVVGILRLLLRVQVVEVAEELVEAVVGRQVLVTVAEVVLAVLRGHVALALQQRGDRRVFRLDPEVGARQPDLGETGPDRRLAREERRATGRAALLPVPVREERALLRDAIDVGRLVSHDAQVVRAHVVPADVVAPDHDDVRLARRDGELRRREPRGENDGDESGPELHRAPPLACPSWHASGYLRQRRRMVPRASHGSSRGFLTDL
jgi:hypothetical protein